MTDKTAAAPAKEAGEHGDGDHGHHIVSLKLLGTILGILLLLTVFTVYSAKSWDLGDMNILLAMVIATVKASLVAVFFMHLKWDKPFNGLILLVSFAGLSLFLYFAIMDTGQYQVEMDETFAPRRMEALRLDQEITFDDETDEVSDAGGEQGGAEQPSAAREPSDLAIRLAGMSKNVFGTLDGPFENSANPMTDEKV
ncbi:cytochrome C oxidase subunit IV family protein, partial [Planctomycetota bacterium]|nr:cytochrome C oxidase subunit IV family protein [Planctomycetota bacterium]